MRVAIWAAVSSEAQAAADKVSLAVQIEKARELIRSRHWREISVYQVDESRTKWASLYHAEKQIPELYAMLQAAERGEFDLLICYDLNRFRSLLRQVFDVLCDYNVQIYALTNPREPVEPDRYDDSVKLAVGTLVDVYTLVSNNQISALTQHYKSKMPSRITDKGLHAATGKIPYGYRKPRGQEYNSQAILEPDPTTSRYVIEAKDKYLKGESAYKIATWLNNKGIPGPAGGIWYHRAILYIFRSQFYAGKVFWGVSRMQRDRRSGKTIRHKNPNPTQGDGKHDPLWDQQTYQRLQEEIARRRGSRGDKKTRVLSRLLFCWCGKPIWVRFKEPYKDPTDFLWNCSTHESGHAYMRNNYILPRVITKIKDKLSKLEEIPLSKLEDKRPLLEDALKEIEKRRTRWVTAFESGQIDGSEYSMNVKKLDAERTATQSEIETLSDDIAHTENKQKLRQSFADVLPDFEEYIYKSPATEVNSALRTLIERIEISKEKEIEIVFA